MSSKFRWAWGTSAQVTQLRTQKKPAWPEPHRFFLSSGKRSGLGTEGHAGGADEADALADFRGVVIPQGFELDREVALEALALQLGETAGDVANAGAEGNAGGVAADGATVLDVRGKDPAFKDLQTIDRLDAGSGPVTEVGAGADAGIAVFHQLGDVVRVPDFVVGILILARVAVVGDADVVFLDQFLDDVNGVGRFGGDAVELHLLGEFEDLAGFGFVVGDADDTEVDGADLVFGQVLFQGFDLIFAHAGADFALVIAGNLLAREDLDDLAAGFGIFLNRFIAAEAVEGPCLGADGEAALAIFVADFGGGGGESETAEGCERESRFDHDFILVFGCGFNLSARRCCG